MRITLTANTDWYLWNFRLDLARALAGAGHTVSLVCPDGPYVPNLRSAGFEVRTYTAPVSGFSLIQNWRALREITAAYRELKPDLVHLFTPVCVLLGCIAARRVGCGRVVAALTGLGHVFTTDSLKARLARPLLRNLFRRQLARPGTVVIFQNEPDRDELIAAGVVSAERCHVVRSSGVDVERYRPRTEPREVDELRVLFASRLLREKGLDELLQAFAMVRRACPSARLWIAGEIYPANPSSYSARQVEALGQQEGVRLLGHVEDMPAMLAEVDIVALPSYREGTPKILLEAAACGLPIVATDIAGVRGVVEHCVNGYRVPVRDVDALADRLAELCADADLRAHFGRRGREIACEHFTSDKVIAQTLAVYRQVGVE